MLQEAKICELTSDNFKKIILIFFAAASSFFFKLAPLRLLMKESRKKTAMIMRRFLFDYRKLKTLRRMKKI
jgi:hypothetical protein